MLDKRCHFSLGQRILILVFILSPLLCILLFIPFPPPKPPPTPLPIPALPATPTVDAPATYAVLQQTAAAPLPNFCHFTNQTYTLQKQFVNNTHTRVELLAETAVSPNGEWSATAVKLANAVQEMRLAQHGETKHTFRLILQWYEPVKHLVWSPDGRYLALVTRQERTYVTDLFDIEGNHWSQISRYTFAEREEMPLVWSPDGRILYFASRGNGITQMHHFDPATWQTTDIWLGGQFLWPPSYAQSGKQAVVYWLRDGRKELIVMEPDGRNTRLLLENVELVETIYWLRNHVEVALVLQEENGRRVIIVNTETGEQRTIADNLLNTSAFRYWPQADLLTFWAEVESGQGVEMGYFSDGTQAYAFAYDYKADWKPREFWSPDGQAMAMKLGDSYFGEALTLVYMDGRSPQIIYDQLQGLGNPLWSPDSNYVAFTQLNPNAVPQTGIALEIRDQNGNEVARLTPYDTFWDNQYFLEWQPC